MEKQIEELRADLSETRGDVKVIMTNHLPHIQTSLTEHGLTLKLVLWVLAGVAAGVGSIVVALAIIAIKRIFS